MVKADAVVVAAGSSTRFGADKLLAEVRGKPVLARSLCAIAACDAIGAIVLVAPADRLDAYTSCARDAIGGRLSSVVAGGERRRDSVEAGLRQCKERYAAVHDGARPLVSPELVSAVVAAAQGKPGAIAATRVTDTIKEVAGTTVTGHPDRSRLWAAQTPQVILRQAWLDAAARGDNDETDDAAMLARLGLECDVVEAGAWNLKITHPWDLALAEAILSAREGK